MTDKRRVIDRLVLMSVITHGQNLTIKKRPSKGQQLNAMVQLQKSKPKLVDPPPAGLIQAFESQAGIVVDVTGNESREEFFSVSVQMTGLFGVVEGKELPVEVVTKDSHSLARLVYPVVRAEIARMLGGARFHDLPLGWDLGPESTFPTTEIGSAKVGGRSSKAGQSGGSRKKKESS